MPNTPEVKGSEVRNYIYVQRLPLSKIRIFCYTPQRGTKKRGLAVKDFEADRRDALMLRFAAAGYEVFPKRKRLPKR